MNKWIAEFDLEDGDTMPEHMNLEYKGGRIDFHCRPLEQEPTTKNDLGVDCISRKAVERIINKWLSHSDYELKDHIYSMTEKIHNLPSVTPQEPKTGHWIDIMVGDMPAQACDQCNTFYPLSYTGGGHNFCPNCGAKMIEPPESEDNNEIN